MSSLTRDRESESSKCHRRSTAKESSKALRFEQVAQDRKKADRNPPDQRPKENDFHRRYVSGFELRCARELAEEKRYRRLFLINFMACPGPLIRRTLNFFPFSLLYVMKNCSISFSMLLFKSLRLFASE